jgi:hypothetical protein
MDGLLPLLASRGQPCGLVAILIYKIFEFYQKKSLVRVLSIVRSGIAVEMQKSGPDRFLGKKFACY